MSKKNKIVLITITLFMLMATFSGTAYASSNAANVTSAIESTWKDVGTQIKEITNKVVFPVVDMVLAILLFVKLATSYFDYKKHGTFEFTGPAILFFGLIFSLTAPLYIWKILNL